MRTARYHITFDAEIINTRKEIVRTQVFETPEDLNAHLDLMQSRQLVTGTMGDDSNDFKFCSEVVIPVKKFGAYEIVRWVTVTGRGKNHADAVFKMTYWTKASDTTVQHSSTLWNDTRKAGIQNGLRPEIATIDATVALALWLETLDKGYKPVPSAERNGVSPQTEAPRVTG